MARADLRTVGRRLVILSLVLILDRRSLPAKEFSASINGVKVLLASQDLSAASQLGQEIRDLSERDRALRLVADAQLAAGDYRAAVETAAYVSDDRTRDRTLRKMAELATKPGGGAGGGSLADFDTLTELIQTTVEPTSWEDLGGAGTLAEFPTGVLVDTKGLLARVDPTATADVRTTAIAPLSRRSSDDSAAEFDVQRETAARLVSLRRLERQLQRLAALGFPAEQDMRILAGLYRVDYVAVIQPGTPQADIVLIGPAGPWTTDGEQRIVNAQTGRPVLHLDDLVILLQNAFHDDGVFGCSITPRQASMANAQEYLRQTSNNPLPRNQREVWLNGLRDQLGEQDITVHGIDPGSRTARVIVEADYRMKLVGMGIEEGVPGVASYLDRVQVGPDGTLSPMTVLRWWFSLTDENVRTSPQRDVFALPPQSVGVLSENELLTRTGKRVHTGKSDELNEAFAKDFTDHFVELAAAYPVYAELQNVFDLALVAAVIKTEDLPAQIGWGMTYFVGAQQPTWLSYRPASRDPPRTVQTVINHRILQRKHIVVGVSGGVSFSGNPKPIENVGPAEKGTSVVDANPPPDIRRWWWD